MPKKKEKSRRNQPKFTCPNSACGATFSKPISVRNLTQKDSGNYDACPHCLTAIAIGESVSVVEAESGSNLEGAKGVVCVLDEKNVEPPRAQCVHHFGYLSERAKNEKIPDDCMFCDNIVKCMLKAVNG